jgi:hypothetical protein
MQASGERTAARLRNLVEYYARQYGEDPDQQFQQALERAPWLMPGFKP